MDKEENRAEARLRRFRAIAFMQQISLYFTCLYSCARDKRKFHPLTRLIWKSYQLCRVIETSNRFAINFELNGQFILLEFQTWTAHRVQSETQRNLRMDAISTIISRLDEVFAPMDAQVLERAKEWAAGRIKAIAEFKKSEEGQSLRKNQTAYYEHLFAIAGGKTWYTAFQGRNLAMVHEIVEKHCATVAAKRNASIAKKLNQVGITEVMGQEFTSTVDGFNGVFIVNTDKGEKRVIVETILAGGHNIQCLHMRVLVKVKG